MVHSITPDEGDTTTEPVRPASMTVNLHMKPEQVSAVDLTDDRSGGVGDLVSLRLGDDHASVSVLGCLGLVTAIVRAAVVQLTDLADARKADESHLTIVDGGAQ